MLGLLYKFGAWAVGGLIAKVLVGAGLTLVTASFVAGYVNDLLDYLGDQIGGMPADLLALLGLGGFGTMLSIIGSAMLARVALNGVQRIVGVAKT